ncbi:MAG: aldo/keto reductase [Rhodospirillaceae bacterium]|nr:aldo/keto reductase [Rhodospirillales bacterium]
MRTNPLGRTGLTVSAIGFGAWGIGGHTEGGGRSYGSTEDSVSVAALEAAFDAGVTYYDTAPLYGLGHSEELIGATFHGARRDRVVIATKVGYGDFTTPPDFTPAGIRHSVEASLRRLRSERIDLLQLHDCDPGHLAAHPDILDTLQTLRQEGRIAAIGASVKSPADALGLLQDSVVQVIQANFHMLDLRALDCGLLALAEAQGAAIVARTPLCFGFLTGRLTGDEVFAADDHRSRWPRSQLRAWAESARTLLEIGEPGDDGTSTALRFVLSFPAVATTIPGMLNPAQVAENTVAGKCPALPPAALAEALRRSHALADRLKGNSP